MKSQGVGQSVRGIFMARSGQSRNAITVGLVTMACFLILLMAANAVEAQTFQVLHSFTGGTDGASPSAGLIMDRGGRLYGTASGAEVSGTDASAFKMAGSGSGWVFYPLYDFSYDNGIDPRALTFGPDGNLYGGAGEGGQNLCNDGNGCGTIFKLRPPPNACASFLCRWTETVLYSFHGISDGWAPGQVIFDSAGNLYGTTAFGGTGDCGGDGCGTVFKLTPSGSGWTKTVLYNFTTASTGLFPSSGLIFDAAGNLYGTTAGGSNDHGVVFELSPSSPYWTETVLYAFQGNDGSGPEGPLIADQAGNLYGVTAIGGSFNAGTLFELAQPGSWTFQSLYSFSYPEEQPNGGLLFDNDGNLYGTTGTGGISGGGTAFKLTPSNGSWTVTDLHDFSSSDGVQPNGSLIFDAHGNLYGTSALGGNTSGECYIGCGTVWEITP